MRPMRSAIAFAAAFAAAVVVAAPASADTVQIGSALQHPDTGALCTNCVGVQRSQVGGNAPLSLSSPANGTVTAWSVRTSEPGAIYNLRILRPNGAAYTGQGTSPAVSVPAGTTDSILNNPVSLPIQQGDAIGVLVGGAANGLPQFTTNNSADVTGYSVGNFPDGGPSGTITDISGHELLIQATVKFCNVPNVHRLKKVAAKQSLAAADCGVRVKKKVTNKRKFVGKVLKQKVAAGTTAAPGKEVPIVIGQK
jgi:hypothetical protein